MSCLATGCAGCDWERCGVASVTWGAVLSEMTNGCSIHAISRPGLMRRRRFSLARSWGCNRNTVLHAVL
jgi:hypothetical protein